MNIRFLEPARNELDDAFDWYEMEQRGLGRRFLAEIQSALKRITVFPDSCAAIAPGLRRCMTRKFPFCWFTVWRRILLSLSLLRICIVRRFTGRADS